MSSLKCEKLQLYSSPHLVKCTVRMVSIVLLTTEEVLQRNVYWYCLDTLWATEELEPFEEVKREHQFTKPLSRDFYYAKYPDIPRSESEDETSISINGFINKHEQWKSKICMRRFDAQRRNSRLSHLSWNGIRTTSCGSLNNVPRRATSLTEKQCNEFLPAPTDNKKIEKEEITVKSNDERVRDFFKRLLESVPPPPLEDLPDSVTDINLCSILEQPKDDIDFNDIEIPGYADFEKGKIQQTEDEFRLLPATSTLKKPQRKVSFNLTTSKPEFESIESWYDSIYGVSDLMISNSGDNINVDLEETYNRIRDPDDQENFPSWSEILIECDVNDSIAGSKESLKSTEEVIISRSHCADATIHELGFDEISDEETGYARFAIYKIHQTIKNQGNMMDSSSMKNLSESDCNLFKQTHKDPSFFGTVYRLAPNSFDDIQDLVNNIPSST